VRTLISCLCSFTYSAQLVCAGAMSSSPVVVEEVAIGTKGDEGTDGTAAATTDADAPSFEDILCITCDEPMSTAGRLCTCGHHQVCAQCHEFLHCGDCGTVACDACSDTYRVGACSCPASNYGQAYAYMKQPGPEYHGIGNHAPVDPSSTTGTDVGAGAGAGAGASAGAGAGAGAGADADAGATSSTCTAEDGTYTGPYLSPDQIQADLAAVSAVLDNSTTGAPSSLVSVFCAQCGAVPSSHSRQSGGPSAPPQPPSPLVAAPQLAKLLRCGRCKCARYCSKACQKAHWKTHRGTCTAYVFLPDLPYVQDDVRRALRRVYGGEAGLARAMKGVLRKRALDDVVGRWLRGKGGREVSGGKS